MVNLHSIERGSGFPILVLHGGGLDHCHMLDAIEPVFDNHDNFRRVYIDLPGHGRSDGSDIQRQDDVLNAVSTFCNDAFDGPFALIGESRGSLIARGLLTTRPMRIAGACLIVPGGDSPTAAKPVHQTLAPDTAVRDTLPEAARNRFDRMVVQSAEIASKICATKLPAAEMADPDTARRIATHFDLTVPLEPVPFIRPCLILSGRQDAIAGYSDAIRIQQAYPRSTYAILDTAGHGLAWERPDLFKSLVRDWLDRLSAAL